MKILYYNGDDSNEETKVGPKKAIGLQNKVIGQPRVCASI